MPFINDFRTAIDGYESDSVDVSIRAFQLYGAGSVLNEGEWFRFQIGVKNKGHIDMKNITVRINGTSYAKVALGYGGGVSSHVDVGLGDINAHGSRQTGLWVYGKATKHTNGNAKDVVTARINRWDASLDHLLSDHSGWGPAQGTVNITIARD